MKTLFSRITGLTAKKIAFMLSVIILCVGTIETRATDFQLWSDESVLSTLDITIDGITITSTEGGLNSKNQADKCSEIAEELGLPTTKIFMPSLKGGTMLTIDAGTGKKITGITLYIGRNSTGSSQQCGHGAFSEDNVTWTDFSAIEAKGYDSGSKIEITPSGSGDYRYYTFGRGKIGDVAAAANDEFRIFKIIVTTSDLTPIDDTCGPTITKGSEPTWAGGANYQQGDVPSLTFEVIAEASNGGELTYQWFQYYNNDPGTAEKATGSTNSNTYTPQTDIVHDGYIYYCEITEKGCGKVARTVNTGTVTVAKAENHAIADWKESIGTFTVVSSTDGIVIDNGAMKFNKSYAISDVENQIYANDQYYKVEPKAGITSFGALDTIVYSDKINNTEKEAQIVICNADNSLIYTTDVTATNEYTEHIIVLPADMESTSELHIGRNGGTAYYISDFRVYAYKSEDISEPQAALYDITFKDNRKSEDATLQLSDIDNIVLSGSSLLSALDAKFVYNAKADYGIKLGKSNEIGSLTLTLAKTTALKSIEVYACQFKDDEKTLIVNEQTLTLSETMEKYTIDCKGEAVSTITLSCPSSGKRCYIGGLNLIEKTPDLPTTDYQILFKDKTEDEAGNNTDGNQIVSLIVDDYVKKGAELISSIQEPTNIYTGKLGYGIRIGKVPNGYGYIKINLKDGIKATSMVVSTCGYKGKDSGCSLIVNGKEIVPNSTSLLDFKIDLDGSEINYLELEGTNGIYIVGITITGTTSGGCTPQTKEVSASICEGDTYKWDKDGKTYSESGVYSTTVVENGCDVTYKLTLTVNKATSETITHTAKGSYTWYDQTYTESGIYTYVTTNDKGCKHTITLNLTIEPDIEPCEPKTIDLPVTICEGETYNIGGYELGKAGNYPIVETDENGCEVTTNVIITVNPKTSETITHTAKGSYTWYDKTYTESGQYTHETTNADGCLHTIILNLTIEPDDEPCVDKDETFDIAICEGEEYLLGDQKLTKAGTYTATLKTDKGCDSTVTINLKVNKPTSETITHTAQAVYVWYGKTYTESGIYTHETTNSDGCKHTIFLDLTIESIITPCTPKEVTVKDTICEGERYYVGNTSFNTTGLHTAKLTTVDGCDSIVHVDLTVAKPTSETVTATAANSYTWFDKTYTQSGHYVHKLVNVMGCDSTIVLILTITEDITPCEPKVETKSVTICEGEAYTFNGVKLTTAGEYKFSFKTADGCDSTFVLTLNVNKKSYETINHTATDSYTWFGRELTASGRYTETLTNSVGCDSVITLNLTIEKTPEPCTAKYSTLNIEICQGTSYEFNGQNLTQADTYQATLTTANGCDSVVTLNLAVIPSSSSSVSHTAIGYYTWNGKLYTQSGTYTTTLTNHLGCDSIVTLHLTVLTQDTVKPCEPIAFSATSDNSEGGRVVIVQQPSCENNNTAVASAEANNGWHFTQWSDGSQETLRIMQLTEPISLIAYFEKDVVPCTDFILMLFNSNEEAGTVSVLQTPTCDNGNEAIVSAVAKDETKYKFSKWSDGSTDATHTFTLTRNFAITAQWQKVESSDPDNPYNPDCQPYKLTINLSDPNAGIVNTLQSPNCNNNQTAIIQAVTYAGYQFSQWEDGSTQPTRTIQLTGNTTVTATWVKAEDVCRTYTLTLRSDNDSHGTVNMLQEPDCKTNQNTAIIEALAADNYLFDQWSDGNADNPRTITLVSDMTLYANFTIRRYSVQVVPDNSEHGSVTGSGTYNYNTAVTITAVPAPGYKFIQWSDGNTDNPRTISVTDNITLQAGFTEQYFNIYVSANDPAMGEVYGSGEYQAYSFATIEAEANDGYTFVSWSDGNKQAVRNVLVLADMAYQAVFIKPSTYHIQAVSSNEAMGSVEGGGYYAGGSEVTLTAVAKQGYHFIRWQDDVTDNPRTITVSRDATYYAYFWLGTDLENNTLTGISIDGMQISISGHEGESLYIWSATGQTIVSGIVQPVVTLPYRGVFIIMIGDQAGKIVL